MAGRSRLDGLMLHMGKASSSSLEGIRLVSLNRAANARKRVADLLAEALEAQLTAEVAALLLELSGATRETSEFGRLLREAMRAQGQPGRVRSHKRLRG